MKSCKKCGEEKGEKDFYMCGRGRKYRANTCISCAIKKVRDWQYKNPEWPKEKIYEFDLTQPINQL